MKNRQAEIAQALQVVPPFASTQDLESELNRRIDFIASSLQTTGLKTLVLGISGGVDSTLAGRLSQLAVERLRAQTNDNGYQFIALRLPYQTQQDETDAQAALAFIRGNIKARIRMVAQFTVANANAGLVIGTDHAAEAVMGFFTKYGDGACDLAPLTGLVKGQIRAMASHLGATDALAYKVPTADLEELNPLKPDEVSYGVSYDDIDRFLHGLEVSDAVYQRIVSAYDGSQHKREMPKAPR